MWVCLNNSFLSIVENKTNKAQLLVRARRKGDIEKTFPTVRVFEDAGTDYKFRAFVPRDVVADAMYDAIMNINYGNFKNSVREHDLHDAYADFWGIMYGLQERKANRHPIELPYIK